MSYNKDNVFAKIIRGDLPSSKVYEDEKILAFHDISKEAPIHVLVIPKGDYKNLVDFTTNAKKEDVSNFFQKVSDIAKDLNVDNSGFRIISNTGKDANQTVDHFHVHILGGKSLGNLLSK